MTLSLSPTFLPNLLHDTRDSETEEGKVIISPGWILSLLSTFHSSESPKAWQSIFHALLPHHRKLDSMLWREYTIKAEVNSLQVRSLLPLCISISMTPYIGHCYITQSRQEGKGSSCKWYFHTFSFSLLAFLLGFPFWVLYFPSHMEFFYLNPSEFISGSLWGKHLPRKAQSKRHRVKVFFLSFSLNRNMLWNRILNVNSTWHYLKGKDIYVIHQAGEKGLS